MRNQPVSDGKIDVEAELASVAVGEGAGAPQTPPVAAAAQRHRGGLTNPSLTRKPPASAIALRSGAAQ